jgi:hypothetical protein
MLVEMTEREKQEWDKFQQWRSWTEVVYQALYEMYEGRIPIDDCEAAIRGLIENLDYDYGPEVDDSSDL